MGQVSFRKKRPDPLPLDHFEYRRQKAKAAEFISADLYHHPSNAIVHRECLRIYFGGLLPLPYY